MHLTARLKDVLSCGACAMALLRWLREETPELVDEALMELDYGRPFPEEEE